VLWFCNGIKTKRNGRTGSFCGRNGRSGISGINLYGTLAEEPGAARGKKAYEKSSWVYGCSHEEPLGPPALDTSKKGSTKDYLMPNNPSSFIKELRIIFMEVTFQVIEITGRSKSHKLCLIQKYLGLWVLKILLNIIFFIKNHLNQFWEINPQGLRGRWEVKRPISYVCFDSQPNNFL